jgi:hypothetical protein
LREENSFVAGKMGLSRVGFARSGVEKSVAKSAQALRGVAKSARQRAPRGRCKKIFFQSECFC